jgi:hypothetical protein
LGAQYIRTDQEPMGFDEDERLRGLSHQKAARRGQRLFCVPQVMIWSTAEPVCRSPESFMANKLKAKASMEARWN